MSVEEARNDLEGWDYDGNEDPVRVVDQRKVDRLILEVQAEMPCYLAAGEPLNLEADRCGYGYLFPGERKRCPSCTARMKLKETADGKHDERTVGAERRPS